ncbi:c-type cytochrome [Vibrio nomapromontoriensis]|uniref:c-type cytochrome n=1 Tax=Vibrio nomapromontoriensis TaxID=2910246 RepID=UPI003D101B84
MKYFIAASLLTLTSFCYASSSNSNDGGSNNSGETLYPTYCVSCHGVKGHGDGIAGQALAEAPSNIYQGLNSFFESEAELVDTVLTGNEGMPAWKGVLTKQQVIEIFDYIQSINN